MLVLEFVEVGQIFWLDFGREGSNWVFFVRQNAENVKNVVMGKVGLNTQNYTQFFTGKTIDKKTRLAHASVDKCDGKIMVKGEQSVIKTD